MDGDGNTGTKRDGRTAYSVPDRPIIAPARRPELRSDFALIRDQGARYHSAYPAFIAEMRGRAYGSEAINDAWLWFKRGWERARQ